MKPEIHPSYTELHHLLLTTHYHTDTMLTSSLFPWCAAYYLVRRLVCRNSVELNFVKTGLKCKFGVNHNLFLMSYNMSVHNEILRDQPEIFRLVTRLTYDRGHVMAGGSKWLPFPPFEQRSFPSDSELMVTTWAPEVVSVDPRKRVTVGQGVAGSYLQ